MVRRLCVLVMTLLLVGCGGSQNLKSEGDTIVGKYRVQWDRFSQLQSSVPKGLTPLLFRFTFADPSAHGGLSEEEWSDFAASQGMTVAGAKVVMGKSAYKGADGIVRTCTIGAIQRGLCGKKLGLSVQKRAQMAKQLLDSHAGCKWVGFDRNYHNSIANMMGAQDFSLYVAAKCS